jgi:hypothetical protein
MRISKARSVSLGTWIAALVIGALLAALGLPALILLAADLVLMLISIGACVATILAFRRPLSHAWAFIGAVLLWLALLTLMSDAALQNSDSAWAAAVTNTIDLLVIDLMFGIAAVAVSWGLARGGWGLLALLPVVMVWAPVLVALRSSAGQVVEDMFFRPQATNWLPALYCVACGTLPIGALMSLIDLVRLANNELTRK